MTDSPIANDSQPPRRNDATARLRRRSVFYLGLVLLIAIVVRLPDVGAPLWWDELVSIEGACGHVLATESLPRNILIETPFNALSVSNALPITRIWTSLDHEANPPLYYVLLRAWMSVFGHSDLAARSLSLVLGLGTICFTYRAACERLDPNASRIAALVSAVSITAVYYSQEVRAYAMLMCLSAAGMWLAERWAARGRSRGNMIGLTSVLLLLPLTHYFGVAPAAAIVLYLVIALRGRDRLYAALVTMIAGLLFAIVWGPWLLRLQIDPRRHAWLHSTADDSVLQTAIRILSAPARLLVAVPSDRLGWFVWSVALVVIPFVLWRRRPELRLPGLMMLCVIGLPAVRDLASSMTQLREVRYLVAAVPAAAVAVAALVATLRTRPQRVAALSVLLCGMSVSYLPMLRPWRLEWARVIESIQTTRGDRPAPLVIVSDHQRFGSSAPPLMALMRYAPSQARDVVMTEETGGLMLPQATLDHGEIVLLFCAGTQPMRPAQLRDWTVVNVIPASATRSDYALVHVRRN